MPNETKDTRYVYGVGCVWFGPISAVGITSPSVINGRQVPGLPCCPHCGSMLYEMATEDEWWAGVKAYDKTHPGYEAMMRWFTPDKHFFSTVCTAKAYQEATGVKVKLNP